MFWFMLIALVVVVAAVALVALGAGGELPEATPDRLRHPLPSGRPVHRADLAAVRFPTVARGYRMADVDDVLDRLGAELAHRDERIAELEARLAGPGAGQVPGPGLSKNAPEEPSPTFGGEGDPGGWGSADGGAYPGDTLPRYGDTRYGEGGYGDARPGASGYGDARFGGTGPGR